jgi:hypothetical protein
MKHSKREVLTTDDVAHALRLRNVEVRQRRVPPFSCIKFFYISVISKCFPVPSPRSSAFDTPLPGPVWVLLEQRPTQFLPCDGHHRPLLH